MKRNPHPRRHRAGTALAVMFGLAAMLVGTGSAAPSDPATALGLHTVTPTRLLDTRYGTGGFPIAPLGPNSTIDIVVAGLPDDASAVALNVTVVNGTRGSYLTLWASTNAQPPTSNVNWSDSKAYANSMVVAILADHSFRVFNKNGTVDVVIDLIGYMAPGTGPAGASVLNGTGDPAAGVGNNGDFYINTTTHALFGPKAGGAWPAGVSLVGPAGPTGATGATGAAGASMLNGAGDPGGGVGNNGDFYINTTTHMVFGPKTGGVWPAGVSMLGGLLGAASARATASLDLGVVLLGTLAPVAFDTAGPQFGTVTRTDADTFTVSSTGIYRVAYRVGLTLTLAGGTLDVYVNNTPAGQPTAPATLASTSVDTVLVNASAGDTIELRYAPGVLSIGTTIGIGSNIVVEQVH